MEYFDVQLFLGFPVDADFARELDKIRPEVLGQFIQNGEPYLQEICFHSTRYLGKFAGKGSHLSDLDLLDTNIYSILKKLVPQYPYKDTSLVLFPVNR